MNTADVIRRTRANKGKRTKNRYVNSWFVAPEPFWEAVLEKAIALAKKPTSRKAPDRSVVAKIVVLYGHIVAYWNAHRGNRLVPMSSRFVRDFFPRRSIEELTSPTTGLELVLGYNREKKRCSKIVPASEITEHLNAEGQNSYTAREFLKSRGFDTRTLKYPGIRSESIQDLIGSEKWCQEVEGTPGFPTAVISISLLGMAGSISPEALRVDSANVVYPSTTILGHNCHEGLIKVDLDAAERQLRSYPPEQQTLYQAPLDFIRKYTNAEGHYCCRYKPFSFFGRYFEFGGGIQALKRDIRQALLQPELDAGHLFNYDIKKCQAFGMEQLFKHLQQDTACLDHILDSTRFSELCSELGVPEDLLKTAIYAGVWNGSLEVYRYGRENKGFTAVAAEFVEKLGKESGVTALAKVRDRLAPLTRQIKMATEVLSMPLGAFLTQLEQSYIHAIVVLCERAGIRVVSLQHDGIMTNKPIPEELMKEAAELSGFTRARLVEKAFCDMREFQSEEEQEFFEGMTG